MRIARLAALVLALTVVVAQVPASAKVTHESPYTYRQTFGTALRLLKVDLGLEVTEKDSEWGYLTFLYTSSESGERKNQGSFTFVKVDGRVEIALQIPEMPSYHEQVIMQKLTHKLYDEHGEPPQPPPPKKDEEDEEEDEPDPNNPDEKKPGAPSARSPG